jgi:hypothetical protein
LQQLAVLRSCSHRDFAFWLTGQRASAHRPHETKAREIPVVRTFLAACVFLLASTQAMAQPIFANPFADAAAYRRDRGDLTEARFRLRYEVTRTEGHGAPVVSDLTIDVASDWSLAREGETSVLRDFRLNRIFVLNGDRFSTMNGLAVLTFRVMERRNRTFLQGVLTAAGAPPNRNNDDCDADAELGLYIPGTPNRGATEFRQSRGAVALICRGREIGTFISSDGAAPPPAFWPTMFSQMPTHPSLYARVRASGHAPARLETSFRFGPVRRASWRLIAVDTVAQPYPLLDTMQNTTAEQLDQLLGAGGGRVATDAVAGRAQGGAPTVQSWGEHLASISRRDGIAAAAMLLLPTYNMFPELVDACDGEGRHPLCQVMQEFRASPRWDPAPLALLEIGMAEQAGDSAAAIAAMQRAQTSSLKDHPALAASFALALMRFDDDAMKRVREAGLPTDIAALQVRAIRAFPYNPAYWTDLGDTFGAAYQWPDAFLLYDIAFSLPMPQAISNNRALRAKRETMERIRRDFPDASLPHPVSPERESASGTNP